MRHHRLLDEEIRSHAPTHERVAPRRSIFDDVVLDEHGYPQEDLRHALVTTRRDLDPARSPQYRPGSVKLIDPKAEEHPPRVSEDPSSRLQRREEAQTHAQNIWNSSTTKDTTIHFEMDIAEDVDSRLEELSRLKRLGHFDAAEKCFQDSLEPFSDLLPVAIEYADLLVEKGAYERLHQWIITQDRLVDPDNSSRPDASSMKQASLFLYRANLKLIRAFSGIHSHAKMQEAYEQVLSIEPEMVLLRRQRRREPNLGLDSAEIQVIRYALKILSHVEKETDLIPESHFDFWSNWCHIYKTLVAEGRIWDARDIVTTSLEAEGPINAWEWIFGIDLYSPNAFSRLVSDWNLQQYDESTYLAVLDILVSLASGLSSFAISIPVRGELLLAERGLHHARGLAQCLKENSPELVKSRPYIRWVLAEEELRRKLSPVSCGLHEHLSNFRGLTIWRSAIPIYIPVKSENPMWPQGSNEQGREQERVKTDELLRTALRAARELGDYETEAMCLAELIYRSPDVPHELFARLHHLQNSLQGNVTGSRQTCLTRFLLANTIQTRQGLLDELRRIRSHISTGFTHALSDWCDVIIEKALGHSLGLAATPLPDTQRNQFSTYLPQYIKDQLIYLGLDKMYGLEIRGDRVRSPSIPPPMMTAGARVEPRSSATDYIHPLRQQRQSFSGRDAQLRPRLISRKVYRPPVKVTIRDYDGETSQSSDSTDSEESSILQEKAERSSAATHDAKSARSVLSDKVATVQDDSDSSDE